MQPSKYAKRTLKAILFLILFFLFIEFFNAAFELNGKETEGMLARYSEQMDIDTVFVGNSVGKMLDAGEYSDQTGEHAFNMCTPSQSLPVSLKNIEMASSQRKLKKAVLLMDLDTIDSGNYDWVDHMYDRVVNSAAPLSRQIMNRLISCAEKSLDPDMINTERSINIWIPWEDEVYQGFPQMLHNLYRRYKRLVKRKKPGSKFAYDLTKSFYETAPGELSDEEEELLDKDIAAMEELPLPAGMMDKDKIRILADICTYCRDNDIDFYVVVTPHRSDFFERTDDFREEILSASTFLNDFISKRGFRYFDPEKDGDPHRILPDHYFDDWEHINKKYRHNATVYLTDVISKISS